MITIKEIYLAKYLIVALAGSIFATEIVIMLCIDMLPPLSDLNAALLDATLLLTFTFPAIYFFAFKPLKNQLIYQIQVESDLFKVNQDLVDYENELEVNNFKLKQANIALKESSEHFTQLFDHAPIGYIILNNEHAIIDINITGAELLGAEKENILGRKITYFLPPEEYPIWQSQADLLSKSSTKQSCKLVVQRKDNSVFYAFFYSRRDDPLVSSNIRISFTDITKQNWASFNQDI